MSKTFNKGMSEAEKLISKERVTRPIYWYIDDPFIDSESDMVGVNVNFFIHNKDRDRDRRGRDGQMEVFFEKDEISPVLKAVEQLNEFARVNKIGEISDIRDKIFNELNITLCDIYEKGAVRDGSLVYKSILSKLFYDEEINSKMKKLIRIETMLNLLKRPSVFYSEELRELFA